VEERPGGVLGTRLEQPSGILEPSVGKGRSGHRQADLLGLGETQPDIPARLVPRPEIAPGRAPLIPEAVSVFEHSRERAGFMVDPVQSQPPVGHGRVDFHGPSEVLSRRGLINACGRLPWAGDTETVRALLPSPPGAQSVEHGVPLRRTLGEPAGWCTLRRLPRTRALGQGVVTSGAAGSAESEGSTGVPGHAPNS
jgi:hypothetical protein